MANLRTKYRNHNNQLIALDLSVGAQNPIKDVSGSFGNDATELRIIPYNEYARTQDVLNLIADLIANDVALNAQASSTTFLLSEGVFTNGEKFAKEELDEYRFTVKGGSLKVGEGVYTATEEKELSLITSLAHPDYNADAIHLDPISLNNYYRMDYLLFNYNPSAGLEYVEGEETSFIPPVATQLDKLKSNVNGSSAYVLYSILLHKRNFYSDVVKESSLVTFKNVFEEDTINDVAIYNNEIYVLRIDVAGKLKIYKYNSAGIAVGTGEMPLLDTHIFENAKMIVDAQGVWIQARWYNSTSTFGRVIVKFTLALAYDGHKDEDDTDAATGIPTATGFLLSQSARAKTLASDTTHLYVATKAIDGGLEDRIGIEKIAKSNWSAGSYTNATPPVYVLINDFSTNVVDNFAFFDGDTTLGEKYAYLITSEDADITIFFRKIKLSDLSFVSGPDKLHATADTVSFKNINGVYYENGSTKELRYVVSYKKIGGPEYRLAIGKMGIDFPTPTTNPALVTTDTVDFTGSEMLTPSIIANNDSTVVSMITENTSSTKNISRALANAADASINWDATPAGTIKGTSFKYDEETKNGFYTYARENNPTNLIAVKRLNNLSDTQDATKSFSLGGAVTFSSPKIDVNSSNVYVAFSVVDYQVTAINTSNGNITASSVPGASTVVVVKLDKSLNIVEYKLLYYSTQDFDNIAMKADDRFIVVAASNASTPEIVLTKLRLDLSFAPLATFTITPGAVVTATMKLEFNRDFIYIGFLDGTDAIIHRFNIILTNDLSNITLSNATDFIESIIAQGTEIFVATTETSIQTRITRLSQVLTSELQSLVVSTDQRISMFIRDRFIHTVSLDITGSSMLFDKYDLSLNRIQRITDNPSDGLTALMNSQELCYSSNEDKAMLVAANTVEINGYRIQFDPEVDSQIIHFIKPEVSGGVFFVKEISPYGKIYDQKNLFMVADSDYIYLIARDYNYSEGNKSEFIYKYSIETREFDTVVDNITQVWKYTGLANVVRFYKGYLKSVYGSPFASLYEFKTARYEHLCDSEGALLDWLDAQSAGGTSTVGAKFEANDANHAAIPLVDSEPNLNGFDSLLSADYLGDAFINDFSVIPFTLNATSNLASIGIDNVTMRKLAVQIVGSPGSPYQEGMAAAVFEYPEFIFTSGDIIYDGTATLGILGAELELSGDLTGTNSLNDNTTGVLGIGDLVNVYEGSGKYQTGTIVAISYDSGNDKTIIQLQGLTKKVGNVESNPGYSKLKFFKNSPTQIGLENFISVSVMQSQLDSQLGTYRTVEISFPTSGVGAVILNTTKLYFLKLRAYDEVLNDPIDDPPRLRVVNPVADINVTNRSAFYSIFYVQPPGSYPNKIQLFDDFEDLTVANSDRLAETGIDDYFITARALDDDSLREIDTNDMSDNQCFFDVHTGRVLFKPGFQPLNIYSDYYAINVINGNITADDIKVINIPGVDEVTLADKLIAGNI